MPKPDSDPPTTAATVRPGTGAATPVAEGPSTHADVAASKAALRAALRAWAATLAPVDGQRWAEALEAALALGGPASQARWLAAFCGRGHEPDTGPLLRTALARGLAVYLPRVEPGRTLRFCRIASARALAELAPGVLGIVAPAADERGLALAELTALGAGIVAVPGLGFSASGARLGQGGGYYDRALAQLRARRDTERCAVLVAGVVREALVDPPLGPIPVAPHDVAVPWLWTEIGLRPADEAAPAWPRPVRTRRPG